MRGSETMRAVWTTTAAVALLMGLIACGAAAGGSAPAAALPPAGDGAQGGGGALPAAPPAPSVGDDGTLLGGFLLYMTQEGEPFSVRITNPQAVSTMAEITAGRLAFESVSGPILANGPLAPAYYAPWTWHIDPQQVSVNRAPPAGVAFYGAPSRVEADLANLQAAGREKVAATPAASILVIYDLRGTAGPGPTQPPEVPLPR